MADNINDIDRRINTLLEELKKTKPSPFLAAKIETVIFNENRQVRPKIYQPLFQKIAFGFMTIICAGLGVLSVNKDTENKSGTDNIEIVREIELIHFNEMKIEYPENILLENRLEQ